MKTKDKFKYGIYGTNVIIPALANATGIGAGNGAIVKDVVQATSFNAIPALGYTVLDLVSKASPKIRDWQGTRFAKILGFAGYTGKLGLDVASAMKGESSALVDITADLSMLFNLGWDHYDYYVKDDRDFLDDIPGLKKYLRKRQIHKEEKNKAWEIAERKKAEEKYSPKNSNLGDTIEINLND